MVALLLVAASVGMSNFAAALGIGIAGVDARTRLRVGLVFGAFESGMPLLGLVLGEQVADPLGHAARWIAAGLLIAVGGYGLLVAVRGARGRPAGDTGPKSPSAIDISRSTGRGLAGNSGGAASDISRGTGRSPAGNSGPTASFGTTRLLVSGLALSLDNLVVGFALGTYSTSIFTSAVVIGVVSVVLSLVGLELGARLGKWVGQRGEQLAGVMLISVGIAIAAGALG